MSPVPMLALLVTALLGPMAGASAADSIVKPDPPGVWRILGPDDKDTTSKCIGKPKTPICAVETFLACYLRGDNFLCQSTVIGEWVEPRANRHFPFEIYRFVGSMKVSGRGWWRSVERRFGGHYRSILPRSKPGDIAVFVRPVPCRSKTDCLKPHRNAPPDLFAVRRIDGIWKVVDLTGAIF